MKKKLFTLLALLLCVIVSVTAGDVYKLQLNGANVEIINGVETKGDMTFFSYNSAKHNFNTKFNSCTYDGVSYTSGLKMEGATNVSWTSISEATVTIVQSTWSDKTIKFDGTELAIASASTATSGARVYTITDVAAGSHSVTRGSGESGVFAIYVEYTGAVMTKLSTPVLTVNTATGQVSIAAVANATKITYTTDGTIPTASSDTYSAPFVVADGTTVNAIAIGDGESYVNSDVASEVVYLDDVTIAAPTFNQINGTFALSCATAGTAIQYSLDGGSSWTNYERAVTLTTTTTVKAKAIRGLKESDVTSVSVTAVADNVKTHTLVMAYGAFTPVEIGGHKYTLNGNADDVASGYVLTLANTGKDFTGRTKINIPGVGERTTILGSNGSQCTLTLPSGVKATRLTLYSYVNAASGTRDTGWKEINGTDYSSILSTIPMGANTDKADCYSNPDVRIFPLDNVEGTITFNNGGEQVCFVIALDVIEPDVDMTITSAGWASFSSIKEVAIPAGVTAYYASSSDGSKVTLQEIAGGYIPAKTGVIIAGDANTYKANVTATGATLAGSNLLKPWYAAGTPSDAEYYTLAVDASKPVFKKSTGGTLAAGKAYLVVPSSARESLDINFGEETTGINAIKENANNRYFNLQGVEVAQPTKGLYIVNGKKVLVK